MRRRILSLVLALIVIFPTIAGAMTVAQFRSRVAHMKPVQRERLHDWFIGVAWRAWLQGLAEAAYDPLQCGGSLPPCYVMERESGGNPYAVEPGHRGAPYGDPGDPWHHASGKWQIMPGTWAYYDNYPFAAAAPVKIQDDKARLIYAGGAGCHQWVTC